MELKNRGVGPMGTDAGLIRRMAALVVQCAIQMHKLTASPTCNVAKVERAMVHVYDSMATLESAFFGPLAQRNRLDLPMAGSHDLDSSKPGA